MTTELLPLIDYVPEPMRTFLSQPLTLGMFVPCDEDGNVLSEPIKRFKHSGRIGSFECPFCGYSCSTSVMDDGCNCHEKENEYKAALDCVIFDGFEVEEDANDSDVIMVSSDNIGIDFYPDGAVFMWKMHEVGWDFKEEVKTISDLCGLGIKLK